MSNNLENCIIELQMSRGVRWYPICHVYCLISFVFGNPDHLDRCVINLSQPSAADHKSKQIITWIFRILKLEFWHYYSSFGSENGFKRFRSDHIFNWSTFLGQKMDPHRDQLVDFDVHFHKNGKVLIQEHVISNDSGDLL